MAGVSSPSSFTHNLVATAFATDLSEETSTRKVDLLLSALPQMANLQLKKPTSRGEPRDLALNQYLFALQSMPGVNEVLLNRLLNPASDGFEHEIVSLALALRSVKSVRPAILEIVATEKDSYLRGVAVRALGIVGTIDDIDVLQEIATNDSYATPPRNGHSGESSYPIRIKAVEAIIAP